MYDAVLLVHPSRSLALADLERVLAAFYAGKSRAPTIASRGSELTVDFGALRFSLVHEDQPHVLLESAEIAKRFARGRRDQDAIAECAARFVASARGNDPSMEYFNDFCDVIACAEQAGRVFQFDAGTCKIMTPES